MRKKEKKGRWETGVEGLASFCSLKGSNRPEKKNEKSGWLWDGTSGYTSRAKGAVVEALLSRRYSGAVYPAV